jgi:hypothetical protein
VWDLRVINRPRRLCLVSDIEQVSNWGNLWLETGVSRLTKGTLFLHYSAPRDA